MTVKLFHIFRNTPLGRETLLQSIYLCRQMEATLTIYIPKHTKFLMYFDNDVVQIDLDESYLTAPHSARAHAEAILEPHNVDAVFLTPKHFTASTLPDIPTHFDFMCCPRSISDLSSKIGLGYIGPRVRRIVKSARFPVLITSPAYKSWQSLAVFFGGSSNAVNALRLGIRMSRQCQMPMQMYTQMGKKEVAHYERIIEKAGLKADVAKYVTHWHHFDDGKFEENLFDVPHDALVIVGAFGHGLIRDIVFGSKMEKIQSTLTNNLLIVGPQYRAA